MSKEDHLDATVEVTVTRDHEGLVQLLASSNKAMLLIMTGDRMGQRSVLGEESFVIGRGSGCALVLQSDAISRQHARIEWTGTGHRLIDMNSTNGCFVNYQRVAQHDLRDGDQVQIGKILLKYLRGDNVEAAYHEEFERLVRHDALTGALNKAAFDKELRVAISGLDVGQSLSLVLFDLDHFKQINDVHGHTAGDMVLQKAAELAAECIAPPSLFARVGGEEFAIIAKGKPAQDTARLAERIRSTIEAHRFVFDEKPIQVTISLGVCEVGSDAQSAESLYAGADNQLYAAKRSGRNQVRVA